MNLTLSGNCSYNSPRVGLVSSIDPVGQVKKTLTCLQESTNSDYLNLSLHMITLTPSGNLAKSGNAARRNGSLKPLSFFDGTTGRDRLCSGVLGRVRSMEVLYQATLIRRSWIGKDRP